MKEHLLIFWQRKLEDAYRENYDLQAENARLKAEVERQSKQAAYICASEETKAEIDRLKAEVKELTELNATLALRYDATNSMLDGCAKEIEEMEAEVERLQSIHSIDSIGIEQLKAEVERLSKAGDKMIEVTYIKGIAGINRGVQS